MKCPKCRYDWKERTTTPKKCPLCQRWLNKPDIQPLKRMSKSVDIQSVTK